MYLRTRFPHPNTSAISTVVNNPHKKSAPPKAHATVPSTPRAELPRVRRKDFDPYLKAIGPEWEALQHNAELGQADSMQHEDSSIPDLLDQPDFRRAPTSLKLLPPLSSVPEIFFRHDFDLGNPRTFDAVAEVPHSSASRPTSPTTTPDPSTLAHSLPLLEKLSHHADTIEQHLVHEIARRATPFFAALSNLQDLQAESARCLARVQALRAQLGDVSEKGARRGLQGVQREVRLSHLKEVQSGVRAVRGVIETVGIVRGLVDDGQWGAALDGVDELRAMWEGRTAPPPEPVPPPAPSKQGSLLPSVAEESAEDEKEVAARTEGLVSPAAALHIPLSRLKAFAALPDQLHTLTQEITSSLTSDLVATLKVDLIERIHKNDLVPGDKTDVCDRLRPLIQGLVRTKNLRESIADWRGVVLGEVQGIVRQVCPLLLIPARETETILHRSSYPRLTLERTPRRSPPMQGQLFERATHASVHCNIQLDKFVAFNDPSGVQGSPPFDPTRLSEMHRGPSNSEQQHNSSHRGYPVCCQGIDCDRSLILVPIDHQDYHQSSRRFMILYSTPFFPLRSPRTC